MTTHPIDDRLYESYKKVRNRVRRFTPESMLDLAIGALRSVGSGDREKLKTYQPWNILLLIGWVLQEAKWGAGRRAIAVRKDFHAALNGLNDLDNRTRSLDDFGAVLLWLRQFAFQQFWLQQEPNGAALARQDRLFSFLPAHHKFTRDFIRLTGGVTPRQFMELAFGTFTLVFKSPFPSTFVRDDFSNLEPGIPRSAIDAFLRHLSASIPELSERLNQDSIKNRPIADQRILPTPLIDSPLIAVAPEVFAPIYPTLLSRSLETAVYRTLRQEDPEAFGSEFGTIFEEYVGACFIDAGLKPVAEKQLEAGLPGTGKVADFLLVEGDCNVLVDAKAVEMSALGRVAIRTEPVVRAIKASALKAMEQCMTTLVRLQRQPAPPAVSFGSGETFIVVVTFDRLYLGSSSEFAGSFGSQVIPRLERKLNSALPIPIENVFFLSIDELERLLARVYAGTTSLVAALRFAKAQDADPKTRKFVFQQHLDSLAEQTARLPMLEKGLDVLVERTIAHLPKSTTENPSESK